MKIFSVSVSKLIPEFMGYKLKSCNNGLAWNSPFRYVKDDILHLHGVLYRPGTIENVDWNYIMPIVAKIHNVSIEDELLNNMYLKIVETISGNIEDTYQVIIEFIEYYNLNKK